MSSDIIVTEGIEKTYDDSGVAVHAVRGIDFTLAEGEFTAMIGPSGSGKTTFLNLIAGLDTPTAGRAWLSGKAISEMTGRELSDLRRDSIGFIFQSYNLFPVLTVEENVEYVMLLQGVARSERRKRVREMLEKVGLAGFDERLPSSLSGGQQQRVAVARAMVSEPSLVIADEPTANLDSRTSGELLDLMRELNGETGMTFLFSTHDEIVMRRAKRVVVLRDGKIAGTAEPEDF